jgi:hypothetical protein
MTGRPLGPAAIKFGLVTPVWRRYELTRVCMMQRAEMVKGLREKYGIECVVVYVGDEPEHEGAAREYGFEWVEHDNKGLGAKWNAGYKRARDLGCTHVMAMGSDGFLHESVIGEAPLYDDRVTTMTGFAAFRADGGERLDMFIRTAAGYGVNMIYPVTLLGPEPCDPSPSKMRGTDSSTWRRCRDYLRRQPIIVTQKQPPLAYTNFQSPEEQVTPWKNLDVHRRAALAEHRPEHVFNDLRKFYSDAIVDAIEGLYAARAVGAFLTGKSNRQRILDRREEWLAHRNGSIRPLATPHISGFRVRRAHDGVPPGSGARNP